MTSDLSLKDARPTASHRTARIEGSPGLPTPVLGIGDSGPPLRPPVAMRGRATGGTVEAAPALSSCHLEGSLGDAFAGAQGRLFSDGQLGVGRRRALQDDRGTGGPSPGSATPWGAPPRSREVVQNRVLAVCCSEEQCRRDSRPPLS